MGDIVELFGLNCLYESCELERAAGIQRCPFTNKTCIKMRKDKPNLKIGTCTVNHQGKNIIICPNRLLERRIIFNRCVDFLKLDSNKNTLFLIPEVKIKSGCIDYFLVSAKNKKIVDFVGIELQSLDTSGTLWPQRDALLNKTEALRTGDIKKTFGINWKMTLKTILVQLYHKAATFEKLGKHLVLVIQKPLYERMKHDFNFKEERNERESANLIHIQVYDLMEKCNKLMLTLEKTIDTNSKEIEKSLAAGAESETKITNLVNSLEKRIEISNELILTGA